VPFVNIKQLHDRTSEILRRVMEGNSIFVTRYGKPVAVIRDLPEEELEGLVMFSHPSFRTGLEEARADAAAGRTADLDKLIAELEEELPD